MNEIGYCHGIENYARHLTGRNPGEPPPTLLDYLPSDALFIVDESHQTVPQIRGMYFGDRSRKEVLVAYGFRLPSALDNRPLNFDEWESRVGQVVFVSATPGPYELAKSQGVVVEQIIRPTGLIDPPIDVRPVKGQVDDLLQEIRAARRAERARAGDDAHQADGGRPDRVLPGTRRPRPLSALRHRDARTRGDSARPSTRRLRRAGRHQSAPRRPRPSRGVAGGHPRCRQGRVPEIGRVADSNLRAGRPQRQRTCDHVRRSDDRFDARRHSRNRSAPRAAVGLQRRTRHHAAIDRQANRRCDVERLRARLHDAADGAARWRADVPHAGGARRPHRRAAGKDAAAAANLDFEKAASLRDDIKRLRGSELGLPWPARRT